MDIILSILLTAVAYMSFPLIKLLSNGGRFPKNRAHKIALWNSIVLGMLFCIITLETSKGETIWNGAPAVFYYGINRLILTDKKVKEEIQSKRQVEKTQSTTPTKPVNTTNETPLGMAWYKFLVHFALIAGAIINILQAFCYIFGGIYFVETNGDVSAEQVYAYYGAGLQAVDVLYGLFLLAFAVLAFVLRHKLANYAPDAPKFVKIFYSISAGAPLLYSIIVALITGQSIAINAIALLVVGLVFLFVNVKYFNKRVHLFVDKTEGASPIVQPSSSTAISNANGFTSTTISLKENKSQKVLFCRKCGTRLADDSAYCHYCGTALSALIETDKPSHTCNTDNHRKPSLKKDKKELVIIVLAVALILVLAVGVMSFFTDNGRPSTVSNVAVRTITLSDKFTAQYALATWENGKATEQTMIDMMNEYGAEQGGGRLYIVESGELIDEVDEWCFSSKRKIGDYAIIKNSYGYTICYISGFNK